MYFTVSFEGGFLRDSRGGLGFGGPKRGKYELTDYGKVVVEVF